jgi:hypothetical protein
MSVLNEHWKVEESFWLDGPDFYRARMWPDARMIFPDPVGFLRGAAIVDALEGGPRWQAVDIEDRSEIEVGDTLVLAYRATGSRAGSAPYVALCSSTYVRQSGAWKLLSHQQTPLA